MEKLFGLFSCRNTLLMCFRLGVVFLLLLLLFLNFQKYSAEWRYFQSINKL